MPKIGRNESCLCGSGRKYKKCCLLNKLMKPSGAIDFNWRKLRETDDKLAKQLLAYFSKEYPELLSCAWEEFHGFDDELPQINKDDPTFICSFLPWLLYNWVPCENNDEIDTTLTIPVAEVYMDKYSYNLSSFEKKFISENLKVNYSYYEVLATNPGESVRVKDLLRNREFIVKEKEGSQGLQVGLVTLARVLSISECNIFVGMYPNPLPAMFLMDVMGFKQHYSMETFTDNDLYEFDIEIRDLFLDSVGDLNNYSMPRFQNTDGEDLVPSKLVFDLSCSVDNALEKLSTLGMGQNTKEELLEDAVYGEDGQICELHFPWLVSGNKLNQSWDNTIFAHMTLSDRRLLVEVNSTERAKVAKTEIIKLMKGMVQYKTMVIESIESKLKEHPKKSISDTDIAHLPEVQAKLKEMHEHHWQQWLDMNIPVLKNLTPRNASKTKEGRERLEALFSDFHSRNLRMASSDSTQLPVDLSFLRESLGMT